MKFGKEFAAQMVPEWQEAYMNYAFLKKQLKEIQLFKQKSASGPNGPKRSLTLYRAFSGLTQRVNSPRVQKSPDVENQVILARNVRREDGGERLETQFLMAADAGGERELVYFKALDDEFNKVSEFYVGKVEEVMKEAAELNKQMEALVAFRVKVEQPDGWRNGSEETKQLASDVAASRSALFANAPSAVRASRKAHMEVIDEEESSSQGHLTEIPGDDSKEKIENEDEIEMKPMSVEIQDNKQNGTGEKRPAPLEILHQVKFNASQETPRSAIKGFLNFPSRTDLKFSKNNLKKAEDQLKQAFVEFYHKLRLLKSYSFLNILAFSKIMKKYDKIASRNASKPYMKMVDSSYISSSDEVSKLMERVEVNFIKHFSNSNRSKGMHILRPQKQRERHRITFYTGFLFGCTFALTMALILIIRARNVLAVDMERRVKYMETMFPLYSLFGFIVLHILMYAGNLYFWRRYRVNYPFIFGFKQGTELGYKEVLLLGFSLSVLALFSVLANQDMELHPITRDYKAITELLPLVLVLLLVVVKVCPLDILYRSSRYVLLTGLFHCVLAPLYKVTLPDFFLADQFTSQVQALRSLEFYICYYGWGDYKRRQNNCSESTVFITFSFIIAAIPFMWRLLQCLRRLYDEKDPMQGYNALKYLSTIIAVCARTAHALFEGTTWKLVALFASVIATILSTYWDIVLDWGLLQRKSKNRWLRDKLLIPHRSVYFVAMVLNVLLRLAWMQTVMEITISSLHKQALTALMASLEIIRRGIWNFFRLENEHLNNVGKYRAFRSVPLPFNYDEDEDKED